MIFYMLSNEPIHIPTDREPFNIPTDENNFGEFYHAIYPDRKIVCVYDTTRYKAWKCNNTIIEMKG